MIDLFLGGKKCRRFDSEQAFFPLLFFRCLYRGVVVVSASCINLLLGWSHSTNSASQ